MIATDMHDTQAVRLKTPRIGAGVASGPLNASIQFADAVGLTAGFQRAFLVGTRFVLAAAAIAATAVNRRPGKSPAGATT